MRRTNNLVAIQFKFETPEVDGNANLRLKFEFELVDWNENKDAVCSLTDISVATVIYEPNEVF